MRNALRPVLRVTDQRGRDEEVGDRDFLDALHEHLDRLHNLTRGLTGNAQDAEDLLQETCLLALRGWRRQPPDDAGAWLATVCLNASRSSHRRRSARPQEVMDDGWLLERPDEAADTAGRALAGLDVRRVRDALERLPAVQREAITLMDLGGYTAAQVAADHRGAAWDGAGAGAPRPQGARRAAGRPGGGGWRTTLRPPPPATSAETSGPARASASRGTCSPARTVGPRSSRGGAGVRCWRPSAASSRPSCVTACGPWSTASRARPRPRVPPSVGGASCWRSRPRWRACSPSGPSSARPSPALCGRRCRTTPRVSCPGRVCPTAPPPT